MIYISHLVTDKTLYTKLTNSARSPPRFGIGQARTFLNKNDFTINDFIFKSNFLQKLYISWSTGQYDCITVHIFTYSYSLLHQSQSGLHTTKCFHQSRFLWSKMIHIFYLKQEQPFHCNGFLKVHYYNVPAIWLHLVPAISLRMVLTKFLCTCSPTKVQDKSFTQIPTNHKMSQHGSKFVNIAYIFSDHTSNSWSGCSEWPNIKVKRALKQPGKSECSKVKWLDWSIQIFLTQLV